MKTNSEEKGNNSRLKQPLKQVNGPERNKNTSSDKKQVYIKDMRPIDGAKSGII